MYRKGSVLEIQFSPERLNDGAGDPYWIDLTLDEARRLYENSPRASRPTRAPISRSTRSRSTDLRFFSRAAVRFHGAALSPGRVITERLARLISVPLPAPRHAFMRRAFQPAGR